MTEGSPGVPGVPAAPSMSTLLVEHFTLFYGFWCGDHQPLAESHAGEFMGQSERLYA